jgi:hypothetical protein
MAATMNPKLGGDPRELCRGAKTAEEWREEIERIRAASCDSIREMVQGDNPIAEMISAMGIEVPEELLTEPPSAFAVMLSCGFFDEAMFCVMYPTPKAMVN